ncbi:transcription termination/antitermination factor NusG [Patescibacteria group bacterium]|nr:transcription termination/antitermination factor NusG [Patescibacteria group bacterium]
MPKKKKAEKPKKKQEDTKEEKLQETAEKKTETTKKSQKQEPDIGKNYIVFKRSDDKRSKWYVVHTYSGHETKVTETLRQRVKSMKLKDKIHELLVPTQERIKIQRGQKVRVKEKIFPGYLLVKLILDEDSWLAVRTTPGITGFVGIGNKPTPISQEEVRTIKKFTEMEAPKYKAAFSIGDPVKIIEGPFADFLGTVDSIDDAKGKVRVLVSIFGRETPVELDLLQVAQV